MEILKRVPNSKVPVTRDGLVFLQGDNARDTVVSRQESIPCMAGWAPVANLVARRSDGATGKLLATGSKKTRQRLLEERDDMICKSPSGCKNKN